MPENRELKGFEAYFYINIFEPFYAQNTKNIFKYNGIEIILSTFIAHKRKFFS